jgi:hypothetical protein
MEDVVIKMQEIPCFQSLHHEGKDVVGSLQEILAIFLQEYGHTFGEKITSSYQMKTIVGSSKGYKNSNMFQSFFEQGWQDVIHAIGLERGDHIIISLRAHLKFHMYVFNGIGKVKKENKVWGQKHKQPNTTPKKKVILSLAFD